MATILVVVPYAFYPPRNGGSLRCYYLIRALSKKHQLYVLTGQPPCDFEDTVQEPFLSNVVITYMTDAPKMHSVLNRFFSSRIADGLHTRWLRRSFKESRNEFLLRSYPLLKQLTSKVNFDAVLYENLESFTCLRPFWKGSRRPLQLYDAHNVDSELWLEQARISNSVQHKKYSAAARTVEKKLAKNTDFVFACSGEDLSSLQTMNRGALQAMVVPNGVDTEKNQFDQRPDKIKRGGILFCGTLSYAPNREGLIWFYTYVFPFIKQRIPEVKLTVIGSLNSDEPFLELKMDPTVDFIGPVKTVQPYYHKSAVAVAPILSGSGTRLKILEAMSLGNPVVSTTKGAEGLAYENGKHLLVANEPMDFADKVCRLLTDPILFENLRWEARVLVQNQYEWRTIGRTLCEKIEALVIDRSSCTV